MILVWMAPTAGEQKPAQAARLSQTATRAARPTQSSTRTYVLEPEMLVRAPSMAEQEALWAQGLPVPFLSYEEGIVQPSSQSDLLELAGPLPSSPTQGPVGGVVDGWDETYYVTEFETDFLNSDGNCAWQRVLHSGQKQWNRATGHQQSGAYALWPAADPASAGSQYANDMHTDLICQLSNMQAHENVLASFKMWYKLADAGDAVQVLFSSDGVNYRGLQWRGVTGAVAFSDWTEYRIYFPDLAGSSTVYVKWKFVSDSSGTEEGPWIDDLHVERYDEPASSLNCQQRNPTIAVPNTPGATPVNKGIVLPPYLEDDLAERIQRLDASNVNWVRLEFVAAPNMLSAVKPGAYTANDQLNHIDLKYYDQLIDSLCASGIAVAGLVDNQTLLDQSWKPTQTVSPAYLAAFTGVTAQLVDYFDDRIGYWEVWNEPDNEERRLGFADYARLLAATHDMIKATDASDQVLFGGLGGADPTAQTQLDNFYAQLDILGRTHPGPYDIFAIHPYPSKEYFPTHVETNPAVYMPQFEQGAGPTSLHKFMFIELAPNGDVDKPIWVTELGWNRAGDPEGSAITKSCQAVNQVLVTGAQQAVFLTSGFNILFQQTAWDWDAASPNVPSVRKVFWYQYQDAGVPIDEQLCNSATARNLSPSWHDSYVARYVFPAANTVTVD